MNIIKTSLLSLLVLSITSCKEVQKQDQSADSKNQTAMENIFSRKSVRRYSDKEIAAADVEKIVKAGMAAPTGKDKRPWHFIVLSDKAIMQSLGGKLKSPLKLANKAIVVCGDTSLSDSTWYLDCSAATENILLAAESMGIGAVWTAVYPYEERAKIVDDAFKLPKNIKVLAIVPLGYPLGEDKPKDKFDRTRIHSNKW